MKRKLIKDYLKGLKPKYYSPNKAEINWKKFIQLQLNKIRENKLGNTD